MGVAAVSAGFQNREARVAAAAGQAEGIGNLIREARKTLREQEWPVWILIREGQLPITRLAELTGLSRQTLHRIKREHA